MVYISKDIQAWSCEDGVSKSGVETDTKDAGAGPPICEINASKSSYTVSEDGKNSEINIHFRRDFVSKDPDDLTLVAKETMKAYLTVSAPSNMKLQATGQFLLNGGFMKTVTAGVVVLGAVGASLY